MDSLPKNYKSWLDFYQAIEKLEKVDGYKEVVITQEVVRKRQGGEISNIETLRFTIDEIKLKAFDDFFGLLQTNQLTPSDVYRVIGLIDKDYNKPTMSLEWRNKISSILFYFSDHSKTNKNG